LALFCESVILAPAMSDTVDADTVAVAPLEVPPTTEPMDNQTGCAVCAGTDIEIEDTPEAKANAPCGMRLTLPEDPLRVNPPAAPGP
jgi:hypothetical protein